MDCIMFAMAVTLESRWARSPAAYCLKNEAGIESRRIMAAACTDTDSLVFTRVNTMVLALPMSSCAKITPTSRHATGATRPAWPESMTGPNTIWLTRGTSMPSRVTANVATTM